MRSSTLWTWVVIIGFTIGTGGCAVPRRNSDVASQPVPDLAPASGPGAVGAFGAFGGPPASPGPAVPERAARAVALAAVPDRAAGPAKAVTLTAIADSRPDRYLIKNATLTIEVGEVRRVSAELVSVVQAARGYVSNSEETVDALGRRSIAMQLRVPFTQFDRSLHQIEALGKLLSKEISAEDVTEEFVDSQARLRNLKRTELRLLAHLDRTGRLADTLLVEKELSRVRSEIEQLEARLRFLAHRVAYSTIAVTLSEAPHPGQVTPPETYSSGKEAADAIRSLLAFGRVLWTGAIWIAIWAVVWAPVAIAGVLAYRRRREAAVG